jgi:hypothetical protein
MVAHQVDRSADMNPSSMLRRLAHSLAAAGLLSALAAPAQALVVDTGPGSNSGGGWSLYDDRPYTTGYQFLAARFTVATPDTISSVQGWMNWAYGGGMTFSVETDFQGLPGARLYSVSVLLPATVLNVPDWRGTGGLNWQLQTGDYWLVFEDMRRDGSGSMPGGAPSPLAGYASSPGVVPGDEWMHANTLNFGVRINTTPAPPTLPPLNAVPEPAVAWTLLAGLLVLGRATRRRGGLPAT